MGGSDGLSVHEVHKAGRCYIGQQPDGLTGWFAGMEPDIRSKEANDSSPSDRSSGPPRNRDGIDRAALGCRLSAIAASESVQEPSAYRRRRCLGRVVDDCPRITNPLSSYGAGGKEYNIRRRG